MGVWHGVTAEVDGAVNLRLASCHRHVCRDVFTAHCRAPERERGALVAAAPTPFRTPVFVYV